MRRSGQSHLLTLLSAGQLDHLQARRLEKLAYWHRAAHGLSLGRSSLARLPGGPGTHEREAALYDADLFRRAVRTLRHLDASESRAGGWHLAIALAVAIEDAPVRQLDRRNHVRAGTCGAALRRVADLIGERDLLGLVPTAAHAEG